MEASTDGMLPWNGFESLIDEAMVTVHVFLDSQIQDSSETIPSNGMYIIS